MSMKIVKIIRNKYIDNRGFPIRSQVIKTELDKVCKDHWDFNCTKLAIDNLEDQMSKIVGFEYIHPDSVEAWEHPNIHSITEDQLEDYVRNMFPVVVYYHKEEKLYMLHHDGNHRVNTLKEFGIAIPVYITE